MLFLFCHCLSLHNCLKYTVFLFQVEGGCIFKFLTPVKALEGIIYKVNTQEWKTSYKVSNKIWPYLEGSLTLLPIYKLHANRKSLLHLHLDPAPPALAVIVDKSGLS